MGVTKDGGGAGTPWESYTFEKIFRVVHAEMPHEINAQADGWWKLSEVLTKRWEDLGRRQWDLADAWRSRGGDVFLDEVDKVRRSVNGTADAAAANSGRLYAMASRIEHAQRKLNDLAAKRATALVDLLTSNLEDSAKVLGKETVESDRFVKLLTETYDVYMYSIDPDKNPRPDQDVIERFPENWSALSKIATAPYDERARREAAAMADSVSSLAKELESPPRYKGPTNAVRPTGGGAPPPPGVAAPPSPP
ncbi:MAG: hypothetical protein ACRDT4_26015, partial [Micromonosporaceae bacterium]